MSTPPTVLRKAARIAGLTWIAALAMAGLVLMVAGMATGYLAPPMTSRGLIYLVFAAALPGLLLYRWGRGPYVKHTTITEALRPKAPFNRAAEAGHVLTVETDGNS